MSAVKEKTSFPVEDVMGGSNPAGSIGEAPLMEEQAVCLGCGGGKLWPKAGEAGKAWKEGSICSFQGSGLLLKDPLGLSLTLFNNPLSF